MAGDRQTNQSARSHGERRRPLLRPVHAIQRTVCGEHVSIPHKFDPIGRAQAVGVVPACCAAGAGTVLPSHAVARRHPAEGIGRAGIQTLANHDAGFRP